MTAVTHTVEFHELVKPQLARKIELEKVRSVARQLHSFMERPDICKRISQAHVVGSPSKVIQDILLDEVQRLGFESERSGMFQFYATRGLRPDFFKPIGRSGILIEVERGKIIDNNMDVLDLWKCHVCREADYLFLIIPKLRPTAKGSARAIFSRVVNRLGTFFEPGNLVNVEAVFLFGY